MADVGGYGEAMVDGRKLELSEEVVVGLREDSGTVERVDGQNHLFTTLFVAVSLVADAVFITIALMVLFVTASPQPLGVCGVSTMLPIVDDMAQRTNGRFAGKHVVITGATSGIGRAGARRLSGEGAYLTLTGTQVERLDALRAEIPNASVVANDASSREAGEELASAVDGGIDGLWLNAGRAAVGPVEAVDADAFDALTAVNLRGPFLQLAALAPKLNPGAALLVTSSTSAYEAAACTSLYAATKAALIAAAQCWAAELAPRSIRVNTLIPGATDTNFRDFMATDVRATFEQGVLADAALGRTGTADEVAAMAVFLLSDDAGYITGSQHVVDGGLLRR
ncbi:SDR family oxidoreductase [Gordonia sp. ABSL11-1]|uniref:SDR family oxidoreductase n=1 Tax=Gordonia sp. ABSL11-1 TaxID=3053924 RepID=UPI00257426E4|nr:SDR family oxidoreductase [Gordonia sp. ABSL11-1]MDL9948721.1 SDR family oxidoreductase [Gordonia sp. ABSL11-1]